MIKNCLHSVVYVHNDYSLFSLPLYQAIVSCIDFSLVLCDKFFVEPKIDYCIANRLDYSLPTVFSSALNLWTSVFSRDYQHCSPYDSWLAGTYGSNIQLVSSLRC